MGPQESRCGLGVDCDKMDLKIVYNRQGLMGGDIRIYFCSPVEGIKSTKQKDVKLDRLLECAKREQ